MYVKTYLYSYSYVDDDKYQNYSEIIMRYVIKSYFVSIYGSLTFVLCKYLRINFK